jgi:hypothetical protein
VVSKSAIVGKWVLDPEVGRPVPPEYRDLRIEFLDDGDRCVVYRGTSSVRSDWGAEPYFGHAEGWVDIPNARTGKVKRLLIRPVTKDRLVLTEELDPQTSVRMRWVASFDQPAGR